MPSTTYGYLVATLGVTLATTLLHAIKHVLDNAHVGLVFLLVVAAAAAAGGTRPALLAAALAFLCWNFFFLNPLYTFYLADPRDWIMLVVFLLIGVLVGQITGRLRLREEEANLRERQTAALYRASEAAAAYADGLRGLAVALAPVMESVGAAAAVVYVPCKGAGWSRWSRTEAPPRTSAKQPRGSTRRPGRWASRHPHPPVPRTTRRGR